HDAGTDSDWVVSGDITVTNPETFAVTVDIADSIPGGNCSVTNGTGVVVPASGSQTRSYSCSFGSSPGSGTNTANVTWAATPNYQAGSTQATAGFSFGDPTTVTDECVSVNDPVDSGSPRGFCVGDPGVPTFSYSYSQTVADPAGTCKTHDNWATFTTNDTGATGSAGQTVTDCQGADLLGSKTAPPTFTRTFAWSIAKRGDKTQFQIPKAGTARAKYTVDVSHDSGTDSDWQVSGTITVKNPNDWEAVTLTGVTDAIDNGGSCSITSGDPKATIAAGDSVTL